jgi:hypothetical protein
MRWQDTLSQASYAGSHHVALLICEYSIVLMRGPSEIITGPHKLLDFNAEARVHKTSSITEQRERGARDQCRSAEEPQQNHRKRKGNLR